MMHRMYNDAKLVHADLSEYNILWHQDCCWFIDVAQSVEPGHPSALEFMMRDCNNISTVRRNFFNPFVARSLTASFSSLHAVVCQMSSRRKSCSLQ